MQGHKVLRMAANMASMFNLYVEARRSVSIKVVAEQEEVVVLGLEVDTEEGFEVRDKQKETRTIEVPERTTTTMGTETSLTKEEEITPIEEVAETVTVVL
jgi:hypothetical protein